MTDQELRPVCGVHHDHHTWPLPSPGYPAWREHCPVPDAPRIDSAWALAACAGSVPAIAKIINRQERIGLALDALAAASMILRHGDHGCAYEPERRES